MALGGGGIQVGGLPSAQGLGKGEHAAVVQHQVVAVIVFLEQLRVAGLDLALENTGKVLVIQRAFKPDFAWPPLG